MHYAPQILLCSLACMSVFTSCMAKEPLDPELLRNFTRDVESVLSPTLVEELQGARSNRSAINVEQTVPRNSEPPRGINDKKPEIQFDNQVYPYHYERSYHYQYPPNPQDDSSRPIGYSEDFYGPRFRPKSHVTDNHDPTYYRSELYNPFGTSSNHNANSQASSNINDNTAINAGNVIKTDNPGTSGVFNGPTPLPPSSFAHPDILTSPPRSNPFTNVDLGYRHGVFGKPLVNNDYFRSNVDAGQNRKDPSGHYLPQGNGKFYESFPQRSADPHHALPSLEPFQNYPTEEFLGSNEHRPSSPGSSAARSQHLLPPFRGSLFPPGYQSPFYNSYRPSEHFNSLFSDNFTRNFPLRPPFGGFYPHHNYLPPPPSPAPSNIPTPPPTESRPEDPVPPGGPLSQPIPTTIPDDPASVAAASNSQYELKLFFPARDDANHMSQARSFGGSTKINENIRL